MMLTCSRTFEVGSQYGTERHLRNVCPFLTLHCSKTRQDKIMVIVFMQFEGKDMMHLFASLSGERLVKRSIFCASRRPANKCMKMALVGSLMEMGEQKKAKLCTASK